MPGISELEGDRVFMVAVCGNCGHAMVNEDLGSLLVEFIGHTRASHPGGVHFPETVVYHLPNKNT